MRYRKDVIDVWNRLGLVPVIGRHRACIRCGGDRTQIASRSSLGGVGLAYECKVCGARWQVDYTISHPRNRLEIL